MNTRELIRELDSMYSSRPTKMLIGSYSGRFIYSPLPAGVFTQFDPQAERLATVPELMRLRVLSYRKLGPSSAMLRDLSATELKSRFQTTARSSGFLHATVQERIAYAVSAKTDAFGIWQIRPTTSTNMVRIRAGGTDQVFFYHGLPFESPAEMADAMIGELSDGGIAYSPRALDKIASETPLESRLSFADYMAARGGNFTGEQFLDHPIFQKSCGDPQLLEEYVFVLHMLDFGGFYNRGMHSGWRPGEMKPGFGRPISLGFKGEAFYPPNNSTVDHCALLLPVDMKVSRRVRAIRSSEQ